MQEIWANTFKSLQMIVKKPQNQGVLFESPFDQELGPENRRIKFSRIIPQEELSSFYLSQMDSSMGAAIKDARIFLGALIIKHHESLGGEATIFAIQENLHMQYFLGLTSLNGMLFLRRVFLLKYENGKDWVIGKR